MHWHHCEEVKPVTALWEAWMMILLFYWIFITSDLTVSVFLESVWSPIWLYNYRRAPEEMQVWMSNVLNGGKMLRRLSVDVMGRLELGVGLESALGSGLGLALRLGLALMSASTFAFYTFAFHIWRASTFYLWSNQSSEPWIKPQLSQLLTANIIWTADSKTTDSGWGQLLLSLKA